MSQIPMTGMVSNPFTPETAGFVIAGPECSGKSTLSRALADHFKGYAVPEALRVWCERKSRVPQHPEEMVDIAHLHLEQVSRTANRKPNGPLFVDGSLRLLAFYSEVYLKNLAPELASLANDEHPQAFLICHPDFPWQPDRWRDASDKQEDFLYQIRIRHDASPSPCLQLKGSVEQRVRRFEQWLKPQILH